MINGPTERVDSAVADDARGRAAADGAAFDVTDEAAVAAFERFDAAGIAIDILVNNAGMQRRKPLDEFSHGRMARGDRHQPDSVFLVGRRRRSG